MLDMTLGNDGNDANVVSILSLLLICWWITVDSRLFYEFVLTWHRSLRLPFLNSLDVVNSRNSRTCQRFIAAISIEFWFLFHKLFSTMSSLSASCLSWEELFSISFSTKISIENSVWVRFSIEVIHFMVAARFAPRLSNIFDVFVSSLSSSRQMPCDTTWYLYSTHWYRAK